jgi:3-phenylpropionate/cinnamic acid dioxygenase small subunit
VEIWELVAREQIRDTLSRYNSFGDRGMSEEYAAQFTEDGVFETRNGIRAEGRDAIASFLRQSVIAGSDRSKPSAERPLVRHHLSNILFLEVEPDRARVSSYFLRLHRDRPEHWGLYRDVLVPTDDSWLIAHRLVSVDGETPR